MLRSRDTPLLIARAGAARVLLLALLSAATAAAADASEQLVFQQGVSGYAGAVDLHLSIPEDFTGNGHHGAEFRTDPRARRFDWARNNTYVSPGAGLGSNSWKMGQADLVGLLRFGGIHGPGASQIPPGSVIQSATLTLRTLIMHPEKSGPAANLHRVLVDWDDTTTWSSFGAAPGPDVITDYLSTVDATTPLMPDVVGSAVPIDVTTSLVAWTADPASNRGWLFLPYGVTDSIEVSGSALGTVTGVTVDLEIDTLRRGEIVATLRHGAYTSLLLDNVGSVCHRRDGDQDPDFDVTLDDAAAIDVHDADSGVGTYRPDGACLSLPLCTGGGTGGLCGQPADGEWELKVSDEHFSSAAAPAQLVSWSITLSDGVNSPETYTSSPGLVLPDEDLPVRFTGVSSSDAPDAALRPMLAVDFERAIALGNGPLEVHHSPATHDAQLVIPNGANGAAPVTVSVASSAPGVAQATASPYVFAQGGPTIQTIQIAVSGAGSATLSTTNDASLPDTWLDVVASDAPIRISDDVYAEVSAADRPITVSIPSGANAAGIVNVTLSSSDTNVADFVGGSPLSIHFAAGGPTEAVVTVQLGGSLGSAVLTASDDAAVLGAGQAQVALSTEPPVRYEIHHPPFRQLGAATLGAATDQVMIAWQTITRETGGPTADRFELAYRLVGDPTFVPVPLAATEGSGSTSRLNHSGVIVGLPFDQDVEYRVVHLRDEVPIATYQEITRTRTAGSDFRFTAFGNSGIGFDSPLATLPALEALDPDLHLLLGDFVYNNGEYHLYRSRVFDYYGDLMSRKLFMIANGNHEAQIDMAASVPAVFFLPENGPAGSDPEFNYSFDYGDVHFAVVSTLPLYSGTVDWLRADLQASTWKWNVVVTHEPGLTLEPGGYDRQATPTVFQNVLRPAVEEGADVYLGGATHSTQRYLPLTAVEPDLEWSTCSKGPGTTVLYAGASTWTRPPPMPPPWNLQEPLTYYNPIDLGVAVFDVTADEMVIRLVGETGETLDTASIEKCDLPGSCFCPTCGNAIVEEGEPCDDGNSTQHDGCSNDCLLDDAYSVFGISQGGQVQLTFSPAGSIVVAIPPGLTAIQVASLITDTINADATLMSLGLVAYAEINRVIVNAVVAGSVMTDPGLIPFEAPGLVGLGGLLLAAALVASAWATGPLARRRAARAGGGVPPAA